MYYMLDVLVEKVIWSLLTPAVCVLVWRKLCTGHLKVNSREKKNLEFMKIKKIVDKWNK